MTKFLLMFCSFLISISSFNQETREVVKKVRGSGNISEVYHVLKSDKRIKNGEYKKFSNLTNAEYRKIKKGELSPHRFIIIQGQYDHGRKTGKWVEKFNTGKLKESGEYKDGEKSGIWLRAREGGEVIERYDHDNHMNLEPIIGIHPKYPISEKKNNVQGSVIAEYTINGNCSVSDIEIIKSLTHEFDQAVIRALERFGKLNEKYGIACENNRETFEAKFVLE